MQTVEKYIYAKLKSDTSLARILEATSRNSKIFPIVPIEFEDYPCLTYEVIDENTNTTPKNTELVEMEFKAFSKGYSNRSKCEAIIQSVFENLQYCKNIDNKIIYMKQVMRDDIPEQDRDLYSIMVRYQVWIRSDI